MNILRMSCFGNYTGLIIILYASDNKYQDFSYLITVVYIVIAFYFIPFIIILLLIN
jgi:hypothetical protein